jgi:NADPH:quinone reductase
VHAAVVREFGSVESTAWAEMPDPVPKAGEVLIRIAATAANYVDLLVIGGKYQFLPERPFVPGKLPAGVVAAVGPGVDRLAVGDRVLTLAEQGGYAEKVAVPASQCFRLPASMSFVDAASMALVYDTAWFALRERARVEPGETVLVLGATGGVGLAAIQLAKAFGARVLAGVSSLEKSDLVRDSGADEVIDLSRPDLRESLRQQVHAVTDGKGADVVLDPLGDDIFDAALRALAWRGRLVVIGFAAGRIPTLKANYLLLKNIEVSGLQVSDYRKRRPEQMAQCIAEVFSLYEAGKIKPSPTTVYPMAQFREALLEVRDRKARGRLVMTTDQAGADAGSR